MIIQCSDNEQPFPLQISIYVFFPVVLFYYFNRPDVYKKTISEKKVELNSHALAIP